jgi:hypothetical protein
MQAIQNKPNAINPTAHKYQSQDNANPKTGKQWPSQANAKRLKIGKKTHF